MNRRPATLNKLSIFCLLTCFCGVWLGTTCAGGGNNEPPLNPDVPAGNRPPRATITSVITPSNDNFAEKGELVTINYTADDGEDQITLRIFASRKQTNVTTADEIPIASGIFLGPTQGSGSVVWNTTNVAVGTYYIFAEANDGINAPVRVTAASSIQIAPPGSRPQNAPPQLSFALPISNLGLSSQDEVVVQYGYSDPDDSVTITLLLDKDQDPSNDDINNPGDPLDPASKIIILPSTARKPNDPVFDGDQPPPAVPTQRDSLEIRTNPRTLDKTAPGQADGKEYRFTIDFSQIPVRNEPYYLRGTIKDAKSTIHRYAQGSITITSLASGVVDMAKVGFGIAGARWTGFGTGENLGSTFIANFDLDTDTNGDFVIGSRFASPRNRFQSGAAYLIFGRRKAPFPPDVDNDGRPGGNVIDSNTGATDNFPAPPAFVSNPYNAAFVGRFGGAQNINSVSSLYRGTTIGMPEPHTNNLPPVDLRDPDHPNRPTSGLTSIARIDMSADGVPDFVFGVPFVSSAYDYHDDDPVDGGCDLPYNDGLPNGPLCDTGGGLGRGSPNDDITSARFKNPNEDIDQGLVIALDGTNNINTTFRLFLDAAMAGQNDPAGPIDDEGVNIFATVPNGMRFRGGWLASPPPGDTSIPIVADNQYGRTVAGIPSIDNDGRDELLISVPGFQANRGMIEVWLSNNYINGGFYGQAVRSLPSYLPIGCSQGTPTSCIRTLATLPVHVKLLGAAGGDEFGYASSGGHFNQDGTADILAGAPGADTQAIINGSPSGPFLTDNGIFYVLFTPSGGFGNTDLGTENPPRVEIRGTHNGDRFGMVQSEVADMNGDGLTDVAFASENMDDDVRGNPDAGFVGVIFGFRPLTGENGFSPEQVGTPQLPGVRFFGATSGAHAGRSISTAGEFNVPTLVNGVPRLPRDFNNDGYGDLLISSPGEIRNVNVGDTNGDGIDEIQARTGVAYLVFGGPHLINKTFNLSQVGSPDLPGIVFISRFVTGSQDEAPLETVSGLGDIDGDGFVDVIVGCPKADFVDPLSPNQRRNQAGEVYIIYGNNFGSNRLP